MVITSVRTKNALIILLVVLICATLFLLDASRYFAQRDHTLIFFSFSVLIALLFLTIGIVVWLYSLRRGVAKLMGGFCVGIAATFLVQTGAQGGDALLLTISSISSAFAVLCLFGLFLLFPHNILAMPQSRAMNRLLILLLRGYVTLMSLWCMLIILNPLLSWNITVLPMWQERLAFGYYALGFLSSIMSMIVSYVRIRTPHERQQLHIFLLGVVIALTPFFVLTLLPQVFSLQPLLTGQESTVTMPFIPLAFGYAILRYQVLIADSYIRRVIITLVRVSCLFVVSVLVFLLSTLVATGVWSGFLSAILMALLVPLAWWGSGAVIDRLFFHETLTYQKAKIANHGYDLETMGHLLVIECIQLVETQAVCLFMFNEATGSYRLRPSLGPQAKATEHVLALLHRLSSTLFITEHVDYWGLIVPETMLEQLETTKRPLYLHEMGIADRTGDTHHPRFLINPRSQTTISDEPLLIPLRFQKHVIGVLALGPRGNRQPYAGPDFDRLQAILDRYTPVLEEVRQRHEAEQSALLFFHIYRFVMEPFHAEVTMAEAAIAYSTAGAEAIHGSVWCWLCRGDNELVLCTQHGSKLHLPGAEILVTQDERDWQPFYTAFEAEHDPIRTCAPFVPPPCLDNIPLFCSYAWLPLISEGGQRIGVLLFTYPTFHRFVAKERSGLEVFARHCAQTLHNLQVTAALRAAYEQQLAIDRVNDAFLVAAASDLALPLTVAVGYVALLSDAAMHLSLSPSQRLDMEEKAVRASTELIGYVQSLKESVQPQLPPSVDTMILAPVALAPVCLHASDILGALLIQKQQFIDLNLSPGLVVQANEMCLLYALLRLFQALSSASPHNSCLHVTAYEQKHAQFITIQLSSQRERPFGEEEGARPALFGDLDQRLLAAGEPRLHWEECDVAVSQQWIEAMGGQFFLEDGADGHGQRLWLSLPSGSQWSPSASSP